MRCRACNALIHPILLVYNIETKQHEELCHVCKSGSRSLYRITTDHEYMLENLREGATPPLTLKE